VWCKWLMTLIPRIEMTIGNKNVLLFTLEKYSVHYTHLYTTHFCVLCTSVHYTQLYTTHRCSLDTSVHFLHLCTTHICALHTSVHYAHLYTTQLFTKHICSFHTTVHFLHLYTTHLYTTHLYTTRLYTTHPYITLKCTLYCRCRRVSDAWSIWSSVSGTVYKYQRFIQVFLSWWISFGKWFKNMLAYDF